MNALINYDVSARQPEVKAEMLRLGYHDRWSVTPPTGQLVVYYLPDTCLWKKDIELRAALDQMNNVINTLNASRAANQPLIQLLRCIVVSANPWDGIPGVARGVATNP